MKSGLSLFSVETPLSPLEGQLHDLLGLDANG